MALKTDLTAKPTLTGDLVLLRPVEAADAAGLLAVDQETLRLTGSHGTATLAELERWYATRAESSPRARATACWTPAAAGPISTVLIEDAGAARRDRTTAQTSRRGTTTKRPLSRSAMNPPSTVRPSLWYARSFR